MRLIFKIIVLIFVADIVVSCKKDHRVLGTGVQPSGDIQGVEVNDKTPVYAYTKKFDSIPVLTKIDEALGRASLKFLGSNTDPYFGKTDVGLYVNATLPSTIPRFTTATVTSAEIDLAIDPLKIIGQPRVPMTYSVFEITTGLSATTTYYTSNKSLHDKNKLLGTVTTKYDSIKGPLFYLRIPVDANYVNAILSNTASLLSNEAFQKSCKGFYIVSEASPGNEGLIYECRLGDSLSGFVFNYMADGDPKLLNLRFGLGSSGSVKFNTVTYSPAQAHPTLLKQFNGDTLAGADGLFLKGMGNTRIKVLIPKLKNFADSFPVAVNRAEIAFNVDNSFGNTIGNYNPPPKLALLPLDANGSEIQSKDQKNPTDLARYDGYYDVPNKRYVFNIARHVQAVLNGEVNNYGFYLVVADPEGVYSISRDISVDRVILAGTNKVNGPKFTLSYIKLKGK